jgi:1,4-dihydroxy-2-naphthoate octaprenyltransferase
MPLSKSENPISGSSPDFRSLSPWLLACRPKTLTAALAPILVGTSLVQSTAGVARWRLAGFALLSSIFIQIGTNLMNDAADFEKGADTEERIGPKRVTQSGLLTSQEVWIGGGICFFLAIFFAIPLVFSGGWPIIAIGLFSFLAGYAYTSGPFPLAYRGFGDLFVLIFFGWVAVVGMVYLNTGPSVFSEVWIPAAVAGTQVGLLATVLIAVNNLRDHVTDQKVGKRTLAVRMGPKLARVELGFLILAPFILNFFWIGPNPFWHPLWADGAGSQGISSLGLGLPFLMLPLGFLILRRIATTEPSAAYNSILAQSALLHLGFSVLLSLGFCLA